MCNFYGTGAFEYHVDCTEMPLRKEPRSCINGSAKHCLIVLQVMDSASFFRSACAHVDKLSSQSKWWGP